MPTSTPKPRRRWYQFSLRTLLVGMLLLCLVVGGAAVWVTSRLHRAEVNRERVKAVEQAIDWIKETGGKHEATTKRLRRQTWLEELFDDPGGADDPTEDIVVSHVSLYGPQVTDAGLEHLTALTNLESLVLAGTLVTDAGLKHVRGLTNLKRLSLWDMQVTDAGLMHLTGLTNLERLELGGTQVSDAGLEHLKGLMSLEDVNLEGTQVTDAGVDHLKGLNNLEYVSLWGTQVTDAGLENLKGLTNLKELWLNGTQVTDDGVNELRRALPNCFIYH